MRVRDAVKRILTGPQPQQHPELGRNDRCWCGSGRKYKACHLTQDEHKRSAARAAAAPSQVASRGF
jgi:hypothetical protein